MTEENRKKLGLVALATTGESFHATIVEIHLRHAFIASKVFATDESSQSSEDRPAISLPGQTSRTMPSSESREQYVRFNR